MKQTLLSLLLFPALLAALPVMNAADPALSKQGLIYRHEGDKWSWRVGFRGDYVYDHKMENYGALLNRYALFANEGLLILNLRDRVDIYGVLGAATQSFQGTVSNQAGSTADLKISYAADLIWGVGVRGILWQINDSQGYPRSFLTLSLDYESVNRETPSEVILNGALADAQSVESLLYTETQMALSFAYRISQLTPYIALTWDNARANMPLSLIGDGYAVQNMHNSPVWGFALGATLLSAKCMAITAEARFVTEKAVTIVGSFRF